MSVVERLSSQRPPWWVRRCLRSRKLSRWFLPSTERRLTSIVEHLAGRRVEVETWVPGCEFAPADPQVVVGDPAVIFGRRPADLAHPPVTHVELGPATVYGLSNLVHVGDEVLYGDMVRIETDRLAEENQRGVSVDVASRTIRMPALHGREYRVAEAVSLLDATAPNYAHWLTEILPKAALWTRFAGRPEVPLLVDADLPRNIMRALELVVSPEQRIVIVPPRHPVRVDVLHHISPPGHIPFEPRDPAAPQHSHGTFSTAALWMTIGRIKSAIGIDGSAPQDQTVFVERKSSIRNVLNRDELAAFVARRGWAVVAPETLSFDDQVRLFHRARLMVGPTGAALANLLFARPGCRIGVMMAMHVAMPYFYWHNIARTRGVDVEYVLCRPEPGCPRGFHSDFEAPVAEMQRHYGSGGG